jgi:hypothetical protein
VDAVDGLTWTLDPGTVERYDPASHGWVEHKVPTREQFPEGFDRPFCHWREFWSREGERLVVEWVGPLALRAVMLNGEINVGPMTSAEFEAAWMRKG